MEKLLLIAPGALDSMRPRMSDHLVLDWLQLQQAGLAEFKITDLEKVLGIPRTCSKHKIPDLIKAGLIIPGRMESTRRIYKLIGVTGIGTFNGA